MKPLTFVTDLLIPVRNPFLALDGYSVEFSSPGDFCSLGVWLPEEKLEEEPKLKLNDC